MQYLTGIMFEFHTMCNLSDAHPWCPSGHRYGDGPTLRDADIVDLACLAWRDFDFRGRFGFHYYNEPMVQWERLLGLLDLIQAELPEATFALWTNGTHIDASMEADLNRFAVVVVTDYGNIDTDMIRRMVPYAEIIKSRKDDRLTFEADLPTDHPTPPCIRPLTELIVDYWGNLHICCYDWRGRSSPGNVLIEEPAECFRRWQSMRDGILTARRIGDMPAACRRCGQRDLMLQTYSPEIATKALDYVFSLQKKELCHAR